jgi:hypothetical protein
VNDCGEPWYFCGTVAVPVIATLFGLTCVLTILGLNPFMALSFTAFLAAWTVMGVHRASRRHGQ